MGLANPTTFPHHGIITRIIRIPETITAILQSVYKTYQWPNGLLRFLVHCSVTGIGVLMLLKPGSLSRNQIAAGFGFNRISQDMFELPTFAIMSEHEPNGHSA